MIAIIRLLIVGFVVLTIIYLIARTYARSVRREALEKEWDANPPEGQGATEREAFIEAGMQAYEHGLKRKLLWLVYILPMIAFALVVYYINYQGAGMSGYLFWIILALTLDRGRASFCATAIPEGSPGRRNS